MDEFTCEKKAPLASDYHPLTNKFKPPPTVTLFILMRIIFLPPPHDISNPKTNKLLGIYFPLQ